MRVTDARIIDLPKISDPKGNLTFIEGDRHVPFEIRRVYYTYDVPGGTTRGGHSHRRLHEFIVAVGGSFDVILDDGSDRSRFFLNRPYRGLYVPAGLWRELENFSSGSVCLVLASEPFDEADYCRDHEQFVRQRSGA